MSEYIYAEKYETCYQSRKTLADKKRLPQLPDVEVMISVFIANCLHNRHNLEVPGFELDKTIIVPQIPSSLN